MARGKKIPITPTVLGWAIQESGYEPAEVAAAAGVDRGTLAAWLAKSDLRPSLTQFRRLASFLKRPEAVFFLPRPPPLHLPEVQFRSPSGVKHRPPSPEERLHIREAARLQRGLAWVLEELGERPQAMQRIALLRNPEEAATAARREIGVAVEQQLDWSSASAAQHGWRAALERRGVFVLFLPMGEESVQGFSLADEQAPLIAVNTHWNAQARCYTMLHEYAHLLTRTSSLCAKDWPRSAKDGDRTERWCEEFAAAFLLPWPAVEQRLSDRFHWRPGATIASLDAARYVANQFHVSLPAAVLRLVLKEVAGWGLFRSIPAHAERKPRGGPPGEGGRRRPQRRLDEFGAQTARTFLRGMQRDVITRDDALRYLDVADRDLEELQALSTTR